MKDSILIAASVISIIVLLLIACGLVAFLLAGDYFSIQPGQSISIGPQDDGGQSGGDAVIPPNDSGTGTASSADLERWGRIGLESVETGCLKAAKEQAGDSASLVYDCTCEETVSSGRKTYGCEIDTADPFTRYFANIDCFLSDASCSIATNYGTITLSFEEMDAWYG